MSVWDGPAPPAELLVWYFWCVRKTARPALTKPRSLAAYNPHHKLYDLEWRRLHDGLMGRVGVVHGWGVACGARWMTCAGVFAPLCRFSSTGVGDKAAVGLAEGLDKNQTVTWIK